MLLTYLEGFRWWNMGYAAAVSFVLFLIILGLTLALGRWRAEPAARGTS
jgi:ABC-type sugar transport system permease subunit